MPLYMDFHKNVASTFDEVITAHMADLEVQAKYHVKYQKFWMNPREGSIFCLIEAPDRESCEAVHRESHGQLACSIVEVDPNFFNLFMGSSDSDRHGLVQLQDGSVDLGYRHIVVASFWHKHPHVAQAARHLVSDVVCALQGSMVTWPTDDSTIAVFHNADVALGCASNIRQALQAMGDHDNGRPSFRIGVGAGQPLTETTELFEAAVRITRRLCAMAHEEVILVSPLVRQLCLEPAAANGVKFLTERDEHFVLSLLSITEAHLADDAFTVDTLSRIIGISRPQLYRRITGIAGRSPNDLLRDLRMEKALSLLQQRKGNVSEIALDVGYNNASYFAKCFHQKFGFNPSKFAQVHGN